MKSWFFRCDFRFPGEKDFTVTRVEPPWFDTVMRPSWEEQAEEGTGGASEPPRQ